MPDWFYTLVFTFLLCRWTVMVKTSASLLLRLTREEETSGVSSVG